MFIKSFLLVLTTCVSFNLSGQSILTDHDLSAFVSVYMEYKDVETNYADHLPEGITVERYRDIFTKTLFGEEADLTASENRAIEEWRIAQDDREESKNVLDSLCKKHKLEPTSYVLLLEKYKRDMVFHNSLKPFFRTYIMKLR